MTIKLEVQLEVELYQIISKKFIKNLEHLTENFTLHKKYIKGE